MTYAPVKFEAAMSNYLGGNAFTRNIFFDLDPRSMSHNHCPPIMWPTYLQSFKMLRSMVKEMHLQENKLFDLDPKVKGNKVTQNIAQYPRYYVTYATAKFDVATPHG